jgi:glucosyl-3-phosphoglycerate synthase
MVGLLSDSYFVGAEIVRRRIFADFALAHTLQFDAEVCSGQLRLNPAFLARDGDLGPAICKSHVIRRLREDRAEPRVAECWAMGDNANDLGMLQAADRAFVIEPKSPLLAQVPGVTVVSSFDELLSLMPESPAAA